VAEKSRETHFLTNEDKEKWIQDNDQRETAVARKRVEDAETAIKKVHNDMINADNTGLTTREPKTMCEEMMIAFRDSLSDLASSDDEEDGDDEDDEGIELCKMSEDHKPSWVVGTISNMEQLRIERFWQMQMKLDKLTQLGWQDVAEYCLRSDEMNWSTEINVLAVVNPQTDEVAVVPAPTPFGELMEAADIVTVKLPMRQRIPRPGSSHLRLGSGRPYTNKRIVSCLLHTKLDSSPNKQKKHVGLVTLYLCIFPPELITI